MRSSRQFQTSIFLTRKFYTHKTHTSEQSSIFYLHKNYLKGRKLLFAYLRFGHFMHLVFVLFVLVKLFCKKKKKIERSLKLSWWPHLHYYYSRRLPTRLPKNTRHPMVEKSGILFNEAIPMKCQKQLSGCSTKKVFCKFSQNWQENTSAGFSF